MAGKMRMSLEAKGGRGSRHERDETLDTTHSVQERTAELNESEARYRALARRHATLSEVSPVGVFMLVSFVFKLEITCTHTFL